MVRLHAEHDLTRQEHDDARGRINDLLGEVEKERDLKLKAKDISTWLAMEAAWDRAKIHALENEVSR
jgi:hypothetical protein